MNIILKNTYEIYFFSESNAASLRGYYEKYLFPYDIFISGATIPEVIS